MAPNWTTNEDLLGYRSPSAARTRTRSSAASCGKQAASGTHPSRENRAARPYHVILDEMNLARVEYYFAASFRRWSSAPATARRLSSSRQDDTVTLGPNLRFVGTVNIDETTHLFADKVFDRAQLVELSVDRDDSSAHR